MNPEEKWRRLINPTCADDYGLSMSLDELRQVPEASAVVKYTETVKALHGFGWRYLCELFQLGITP